MNSDHSAFIIELRELFVEKENLNTLYEFFISQAALLKKRQQDLLFEKERLAKAKEDAIKAAQKLKEHAFIQKIANRIQVYLFC